MPSAGLITPRPQLAVEAPGNDKRLSPKGNILGPAKDGIILLISGAVLALSAPGIGLWPLAWFGLAPLLLQIACSRRPLHAAFGSFAFGLGYALVFMKWLLSLPSLAPLHIPGWQTAAVALSSWLVVSLHQAFLIALFGAAFAFLLQAPFFARQRLKPWYTIVLSAVCATLWLLIVNRLGNARELLGVPWPMLEYTQYKLVPLIQAAKIIGGTGLEFLIVMANVLLATLIATVFRQVRFSTLADLSARAAARNLVLMALTLGLICLWGQNSAIEPQADMTCTVLQGNVDKPLQLAPLAGSLKERIQRLVRLTGHNSCDVCFWPETAVPCDLTQVEGAVVGLRRLAIPDKSDIVVGALGNINGCTTNAAYCVDKTGKLLNCVYHKRYLVPFLEYFPDSARYVAGWSVFREINRIAVGISLNSGSQPVVIAAGGGKVGPLICFEVISPDLTRDTVRQGAEMLVDLSDLSWWQDPMIGDQMISFCVMRAVENGRYFVYDVNGGPSAIISPTGRILQQTKFNQRVAITGKFAFLKGQTFFTRTGL